jgi:hypothetical protein
MVTTSERLPEGTLVTAEVIEHHPWGVHVRLLAPAPGTMGVIDVLCVTDERPFEPFTDYPPIGRQLEAVVIAHAPNGQLRLSSRDSDIDRAHAERRGQ